MIKKKNLRSIISSSIGNILEWYDFGLFTIFSPLLSRKFFPVEDQNAALIATFGIFAIGFICRPIGALFFGFLGDTHGRAKTLRLSILMISIPTLLIGFLPTYQQVGLLAPILLVAIRMLQGVSIGGEYSGNIVYLAESAPKESRGIITALASSGANCGILLATLVGIICSTLLTQVQLESWGWRFAYIISGIICVVVYITRLKIPESQVFDYVKHKMHLPHNPIKFVFKYNSPQLLRTLGLVTMGSTFYYFAFIYVPVYLQEVLHMPIAKVSSLMSLMIALMIILIPFSGRLSDKLGRRTMLLFNASIIAIFVVPGFYFLHNNTSVIISTVLLLFTLFSSLEQGTTSIALVENFPPPARYTGVALGYNIGNGFLGGTVPMICEYLTTKFHMLTAPAIYIAICALITWLVVWFFVPETNARSLT